MIHRRKESRMSEERLRQIERKIDWIKEALLKTGPLTCQYKDPRAKSGPY